jgi:hypothetical protein
MPVIASRTGYTAHGIVMLCVAIALYTYLHRSLHIPAVALRGWLFRDLLTKKKQSPKRVEAISPFAPSCPRQSADPDGTAHAPHDCGIA